MYARFRKLDRSRKGYITADDLMTVPELLMTPLAPRIVAVLLEDYQDGMNFSHFATVLSTFLDRSGAFVKEKCEVVLLQPVVLPVSLFR